MDLVLVTTAKTPAPAPPEKVMPPAGDGVPAGVPPAGTPASDAVVSGTNTSPMPRPISNIGPKTPDQ
jgi:hypothetical protein